MSFEIAAIFSLLLKELKRNPVRGRSEREEFHGKEERLWKNEDDATQDDF